MKRFLFSSVGWRLATFVLIAASTGTSVGCAGFADETSVREVDWRRVNAIESSAKRYGAQIIWVQLPEKNVPTSSVNEKLEKAK